MDFFIRLRQNTPWLATGMNGGANLAVALLSEGGLTQASAEFRLACATDAPRLAAGCFTYHAFPPKADMLSAGGRSARGGKAKGRDLLFCCENSIKSLICQYKNTVYYYKTIVRVFGLDWRLQWCNSFCVLVF